MKMCAVVIVDCKNMSLDIGGDNYHYVWYNKKTNQRVLVLCVTCGKSMQKNDQHGDTKKIVVYKKIRNSELGCDDDDDDDDLFIFFELEYQKFLNKFDISWVEQQDRSKK